MKKSISFTLIVFTIFSLLGVLSSASQPVQADSKEIIYFTVNTFEDLKDHTINGECSVGTATGGLCSLRAAVTEAGKNPQNAYTIELKPGEYKLTLNKPSFEGEDDAHFGDLDLSGLSTEREYFVTISGIDKDNPAIINANHIDRALEVHTSQKVYLYNLIIKNGMPIPDSYGTAAGGGILFKHNSAGYLLKTRLTQNGLLNDPMKMHGGAIYTSAKLLWIFETEIDHNSARWGAAIDHSTPYPGTSPSLFIDRSSIHHNGTKDAMSIISLNDEATIANSTITENLINEYNMSKTIHTNVQVTLQNVTITQRNAKTVIGDTPNNKGVKITQSILLFLDNVHSDYALCSKVSGNWISGGGNIFSDDSCAFDLGKDLIKHHSEVGLGSLGHYGGPTPSLPLIKGSPAINFSPQRCEYPDAELDAQLFGNPVRVDQRVKRRDDGRCDAGAFERQVIEDEGYSEVSFPLILNR